MEREFLEGLEKIATLYDDDITRKILKKNPHITFGEFLKTRDKYIDDMSKKIDLIDLGLIIIGGAMILVCITI